MYIWTVQYMMYTLDGHQKQSCYGKPFWKRLCQELLDEKARKWQSLNAKRYGEKRKRLGENWQLPMVIPLDLVDIWWVEFMR